MRLAIYAALFAISACGGGMRYIGGTKIPDTDENRAVLDTVEQYRRAVERKDTAALVAMASKNYWEDGGTPTGGDDYGYDGLREVLATRFAKAEQIRYFMKYVGVRHRANRATVDVLIDASFTIQTAQGPSRVDKRDQNQLVLENDGGRWLFVSGM